MTQSRTEPVELDLDRRSHLKIVWADGRRDTLPLALVRRNCPCAECRARRDEQARNPLAVVPLVADAAQMVTAADAELVGHYALRIKWLDGHDTGIYEFRLLRALGEGLQPG